ncbi:MAG: hypothetical protein FWD61_20725 [Phycisphaerales bacterium]|nr:hypothetical protein [Phycisphaerales bacterium]
MGKPVYYHLGQFPPKTLDLARLASLIGSANANLGRYAGLLDAIPNAHILLAPLSTQEAVLSSKIEGTQVTMGEVVLTLFGNYWTLRKAKRCFEAHV